MAAFDFKKQYKNLYQPKTAPGIVDVPEMTFIMVNGKGNPNTGVEYKTALELLYGLSYAIKMSHKSSNPPEGYFDYVVAPLEGLWWLDDENFDGIHLFDKDKFYWTAMIRQPNFVTQQVFEVAKETLRKKKPGLDVSLARLEQFSEGKCAQIMHIGSYDDEPASITVLEKFIIDQGYQNDISETRRHHEIYLGDPRKTSPEKLKTVIRHPIK